MTGFEKQIKKYKAKERACNICSGPLPAHEAWPGSPFPVCTRTECITGMKSEITGRYITAGKRRCDGPDCTEFISEGRYTKRRSFFYCCADCWKNGKLKGTRLRVCACGCGEEFLGPYSDRSARFVSREHVSAYEYEKYLTQCGSAFRNLVSEYLEGFAKLHYANVFSPRKALGPFFRFLSIQGMTSIEEPVPQTITKFLRWADGAGLRSCKNTISLIATFFKWAIAEGHRKGGNPVIPLIHAPRQSKRLPRPLEVEEADLVWRILNERGNAKLRLVVAIAEETGLRISELCRLKLGDIDLVRRRLFVGLPNKGKQERWSFFSSKTAVNHQKWMKERDPDCGHDYLFYNLSKNPAKPMSLRRELNQVLLKNVDGKNIHDTGFESWSIHRFRHTMASNLAAAGADANVIMAQGGWKSFEAMSGYTKMDSDLARRGYDEAMRRSNERKQVKSTKKTLKLDEYLIHLATSPK